MQNIRRKARRFFLEKIGPLALRVEVAIRFRFLMWAGYNPETAAARISQNPKAINLLMRIAQVIHPISKGIQYD